MSSQGKWKLLAVLIVASALLGAVGWQQFSPQPRPSITATTTATATTASSTQTTRMFRLFGTIFFDYNGNGKQEQNEPAVPNARINLNGSNLTSTNSTGHYEIRQVAEGIHQLKIFPQANFRYMCESEYEFRPVKESYEIFLIRDTRKDIGLMEGFLTLPFGKGTKFSRSSPFGMTGMFDVDRRPGFVRSYDPLHVRPSYESGGIPPWVVDQHDGIDYCFPLGTDIVAAAPGIVKEIGYDENGAGNYIVIYHQSEEKQTLYAHLSEILVERGQEVTRNQLIARSGNSGVSGEPHLHFRYATWTTPPNPIDPYRDLLNPSSVSYWTKDNDPQFYA